MPALLIFKRRSEVSRSFMLTFILPRRRVILPHLKKQYDSVPRIKTHKNARLLVAHIGFRIRIVYGAMLVEIGGETETLTTLIASIASLAPTAAGGGSMMRSIHFHLHRSH